MKMIKLIYAEWRELALPLIIGVICTLAAGVICLIYSGKPDIYSTLVFITCCAVPLTWTIILFNSFIPPKDICPFITAMPIPLFLIFWTRFFIRSGILVVVSGIYWLFMKLSQDWGKFPLLISALMILVIVLIIIGSLIKMMKPNLFLTFILAVILIFCQLPIIVFCAFLPRPYDVFVILQFPLLLLVSGYLVWRKSCLTQRVMRTVILCGLIISVLPWLELSIPAIYWGQRNRQARILAEKSGVLIIPEVLCRNLHYISYHAERGELIKPCEAVVNFIVKETGWPNSPPCLNGTYLQHELNYYFRRKLFALYDADDRNAFMETLRLSWFISRFDGAIFTRIVRSKDIKPEWFHEMIDMMKAEKKPASYDRIIVSLNDSLYYFGPNIHRLYSIKDHESDIPLYRKFLVMLSKPLLWQTEVELLDEAVAILKKDVNRHQIKYIWMPYWGQREINQSISLLEIRLYEKQHGAFPDTWELKNGYQYQRTADGFKIFTDKQSLYFEYPYSGKKRK